MVVDPSLTANAHARACERARAVRRGAARWRLAPIQWVSETGGAVLLRRVRLERLRRVASDAAASASSAAALGARERVRGERAAAVLGDAIVRPLRRPLHGHFFP